MCETVSSGGQSHEQWGLLEEQTLEKRTDYFYLFFYLELEKWIYLL